MADSDPILQLHLGRLAASNLVLQQSVAALASSQKAITSTRRRLSKRSKETLPSPETKTKEVLVGRMRERLTRCRALRKTHERYRTLLAHTLVRLKLEQGILPSVRPRTYTLRPGTGGKCAACGSTVKSTTLGLMIGNLGIELHADCCMLWDRETRQRGDTVGVD
jgi:hypothetical protein